MEKTAENGSARGRRRAGIAPSLSFPVRTVKTEHAGRPGPDTSLLESIGLTLTRAYTGTSLP